MAEAIENGGVASTSGAVMSIYATVNSRLSDLAVNDGQLIFVQDKKKIILDIDGKRTVYNNIIEIETEAERAAMLAPITGAYYFVVDKGTLWAYQSKWIQIAGGSSSLITDDEVALLETLLSNGSVYAVPDIEVTKNTYTELRQEYVQNSNGWTQMDVPYYNWSINVLITNVGGDSVDSVYIGRGVSSGSDTSYEMTKVSTTYSDNRTTASYKWASKDSSYGSKGFKVTVYYRTLYDVEPISYII